MTKHLIIVESAKKAKTIKGILGRGYVIEATSGHVLEMPRDSLNVDLDSFEPTLTVIRGKGKRLQKLKAAASECENVYLATDPDREGEAIADHVVKRLGRAVARKAKRIAFTAITERDVRQAIASPRNIDRNLVEAQTARRVIDRLVGYMISPVLWAGLSGQKGLSAGRVQSPALWLVVDRERTIRDFVPEEWWSVDAELAKNNQTPAQNFWARLYRVKGKKPSLKNAEAAYQVKATLENADWRVLAVKRGQRQRRPYPPFTTDSLQQAASSQLGMPPKITMQIAQQLYEGVDVGEGKAVGLITYLRTDSVSVSPEAQQAARTVVQKYWGDDYLPPKPPKYATRDKTAQEAHEAIRPTEPTRTPKKIETFLSADQYKLYRLIWRRFIASQMKPAVYDTLTVDIETLHQNQPTIYLFRATGETLRFAGFLKVYGVDSDAETARQSKKKQEDDALPDNAILPELQKGDALDLHQLVPKQHFTKPPPRYTEASLIGALKKRGLGRPSTYATIIETLKNRGYVATQQKRMVPTPLGFQVCELLEQTIEMAVDVDFTARMENDLDAIASGQASRIHTMQQFYGPFSVTVEQAKVAARSQRQPAAKKPRRTGSKKGYAKRSKGNSGSRGRGRGKKKTSQAVPQTEREGQSCPQCNEGSLRVRTGKFGAFIGCSRFREGCKYTEKVAT
ncbi:MAG: type I DNA topoisomerase [Chloroflexota bacterium]